ncbi:MAG: chemotaxis protein CheX [Bacillota bacterium]
MRADYINPIYKAASDVLQKMIDLNVERGEMEMRDSFVSTKMANISIGITGELEGTVLFSFSREMALKIVEDMSGMEMEELNKFVTSAIGELANIISGSAMTNFDEDNLYNCDLVPPQVIIGKSKTISTASDNVLFLPLKTEMGKFDLNISLSPTGEDR